MLVFVEGLAKLMRLRQDAYQNVMVAKIASFSGRSEVLKQTFSAIATITVVASVCETIASTSSHGQHGEAMYLALPHRALVGHAIRNLSGVSLVRCSALCMRENDVQCRSFNYEETGKICQLNDARVEEFSGSLEQNSAFSYYHSVQVEQATRMCSEIDATPANAPEWRLVFKGVAGTGLKLYDMWTTAAWDASAMGGSGSCRNELLHSAWKNSELVVRRVKLSLYDSSGCRAELVFNGIGSDILNWFSKERLITSPWTDLKSTKTNYFSIRGQTKEDRRFFINHKFGACGGDSGWLAVTESNRPVDCEWERATEDLPYSIISYSRKDSRVDWPVLTEVGRADYLTIDVDAK
ncbi:uncharacterized protein LOC110985301 [Acanthaster planci]|uniref:Uncharacterized protein LOC110985301 n=1 Tax=Acanthaster planci TaxID=133434 RepID=A0A8B7ZAD7_ACAPL|nr:uncharacterized protein LOC110985301 [Acanthaster planci]